MFGMCAIRVWTDDASRAVADEVLSAFRRARYQVTKAAYAMGGQDPAQLNRAMQGLGHLSLYRMAQEPAILDEFCKEHLERKGHHVLKDGELTAALLQVVSLAKKPMAPMASMARNKKEGAA